MVYKSVRSSLPLEVPFEAHMLRKDKIVMVRPIVQNE